MMGRNVFITHFYAVIKTATILFCVGLFFFGPVGPASAATPDQISGLKLWLDASQGVTKDGSTAAVDGDTVQQWNDRSSGGYNATQLTAGNRPAFKTNIINGHPVLRFNGSQNMVTSSFLDSSFNTSFTFFIVTTTAYSGIEVSTSNTITKWYSGSINNFIANTDSLAPNQISISPREGESISNPTVETFRYNGTNATIHFNTNPNSVSTTGNLGLSGPLTIGSLSSGDFHYIGDIAEIIIYNSALSDTQVGQIETNLMTKYGMALTAPSNPVASPIAGRYITSPQSVTLSATGSDSIRYSTSSTPADCSSGTLYSDSTPIIVSSSETIYVRACNSGGSSTGSFAYVIDTISPLFIFDGDSMTVGIGADTGYDYPSQVQGLLGLTAAYQNLGRSSTTVLDMSSDASTRIDPKYSNSRVTNIVNLMGGTNDLAVENVDATTTYNRIVSYLQARRAAGFKVIVNTILPRSAAAIYNITEQTFESERQTVNSLIRANWPTFADGISDIASNSIIGPAGASDNTTYYYDRVHMTGTGYGIVASYVTAAIKQIMDPIAVSNISIIPSTTTATITWTTNQTGSTKVNYGLNSSYGSSTTETDTSARVLSHTASLSSLTPGTTCHFQTVSTDLNGNQALSTDQSFTTLTNQVTSLVATNATNKTNYKINLSWTNQNQTGIKIEQDTGCNGYDTTLYDNPAATPTSPYEVPVAANTCYQFRISSYNHDGAINTASIPATGQITTPPTQVTGLTNTASSETSITWDWADVTGATGYKVYRSSDDTLLTTINTATSNWTQDSLSPNTSYSVYVRATNDNGECVASNSASAYTSANDGGGGGGGANADGHGGGPDPAPTPVQLSGNQKTTLNKVFASAFGHKPNTKDVAYWLPKYVSFNFSMPKLIKSMKTELSRATTLVKSFLKVFGRKPNTKQTQSWSNTFVVVKFSVTKLINAMQRDSARIFHPTLVRA